MERCREQRFQINRLARLFVDGNFLASDCLVVDIQIVARDCT